MTRLRGVGSAVSPAGLLVPIVLAGLLSWQAMSGITGEFDQARRCAIDWQRAIEALEGGATDYNGACIGLSIGDGQGGIPDDFYRERERAWADYNAAAERLTANPWRRAANHMGGGALVFLALFSGAMVAGSPLGSAVAAWGLSNGWTRPSWARSTLILVSVGVVTAFMLATGIAVVVTHLKATGAGVAGSFPLPGLDVLTPIPALLFYGLVGTVAGLVTGRGEIGGMTAVVVALGDFMAASRFGLAPVFPSSWHQTALGAEISPLTEAQAVLAASAAVVLVTGFVYWYMTRRRDVPDR